LMEGGNMPCILNAANEIAVTAFLAEKISFLQMPDVVEYAMENNGYVSSPGLESLEISDRQARDIAAKYVNKLMSKK
jgi:1-deoxy-D-xylulose-5-phosphate reductoisomerase